MRLTLKQVLFSTFAVLTFAQAASAANAVQAVQLDYVPVDSSIRCNRIIFTSSSRYKNTLFYMSRIVPGTGMDKEMPYSITHGEVKGTYNLDVNFYFPSDDEKLKKAKASTYKIDEDACNWTEVKASINENIADPLLKKMYTSPIPLSCVQIRIPGIAATASKGQCASNDGEVDILTYLGQTLRFNFVITEAEKRAFENRIVSQQGISADIKLKFVATKRNGAITARVNFGTLVQDLQANASLKGLQFVDIDQLSLALKNSISSKSISIVRENGTSTATNSEIQQVGQIVFDSIMKDIAMLPPVAPETEKLQKTKAESSLKPKVSISAALQLLQSKSSSEFTQEIIAAPETATAMTEVKLQVDRINDPNISEVIIRAGDADPAWETVEAGQSFTINPAYWAVDTIKYVRYRNYLSRADITKLNLATDFPRLLNENLRVKDVTINGTSMAQGQWSPFANPMPYMSSPRVYHWIREQVNAVRRQTHSGRIEATREAFEKLNVFISFSRIGGGKMFSLNDIIQDNPFWSGFYDPITNRIVITAKKDLGVVRFREKMNSKEEYQLGQPIVLDRIIEQRTPTWGVPEILAEKVLLDDEAPLKLQKRVVFFVTKPKNMDMHEFDYIKKEAPIVDPTAPGAMAVPAASPQP